MFVISHSLCDETFIAYFQYYSEFNIFHFIFAAAQGRVRYEASLRLGNASIFNINENGKRVNLHYAALLEKYVSSLHLPYFNIYSFIFYH